MNVVCNGKIIGEFLDLADDPKYVLVSVRGEVQKYLVDSVTIECDNGERRHNVGNFGVSLPK